jgi:hypothetical protein
MLRGGVASAAAHATTSSGSAGLEDPARAAEHEIVALPMVVRVAPVPIRKLIGDLSDASRARSALQFAPLPPPIQPV